MVYFPRFSISCHFERSPACRGSQSARERLAYSQWFISRAFRLAVIGFGCGTTAVLLVLVMIALAVFGSCSKSNPKTYSSGSYKRSYSTSSSSYSGNSEFSYVSKTASSAIQPTTKKNTYKSSSSKSKPGKSKDEFSAKDYVDAEDDWEAHQDDG